MNPMWFSEWVRLKKKKKSKEQGREQLHHQGSGEVGHPNHQGSAAGTDTQVEPNNVYVFGEPR